MIVCTYTNGICDRHGVPHDNERIKHLCSLATDEGEKVRIALDVKHAGEIATIKQLQNQAVEANKQFTKYIPHTSAGPITAKKKCCQGRDELKKFNGLREQLIGSASTDCGCKKQRKTT